MWHKSWRIEWWEWDHWRTRTSTLITDWSRFVSNVVSARFNTLARTLAKSTLKHFAAKDEHRWQAAIFNICNLGLTRFIFRMVSAYSAINGFWWRDPWSSDGARSLGRPQLDSPPEIYHFSTGNIGLSWVTDILVCAPCDFSSLDEVLKRHILLHVIHNINCWIIPTALWLKPPISSGVVYASPGLRLI